MKPPSFVVLLLTITALAAWWWVESRLSTAHDVHTRLAIEAAYQVSRAEEPPMKKAAAEIPASR
ncbi:MAG: hypothetical protein V4640_02465 [Verrucomicrobiota bacterium]